ncbi:hypothetical protein [Saccharothrix syringae]|uniref:hypothetical protein n=1 Tax=Saccharothrix syringae TaxID=103733 RepID=UPI000ACADF7E|nr:hypothetical protein [Saccharothrix syringae]
MSSTPIYDELAATYLADAEPGETGAPAPPAAEAEPGASPPGRAERAGRGRKRTKV